MTTMRNNLPHAISKGEANQQKNGNKKSVHCEILHMRKVPAVGVEAAALRGLGGEEQPRTRTPVGDRQRLDMH
jgi:hypothetical protein